MQNHMKLIQLQCMAHASWQPIDKPPSDCTLVFQEVRPRCAGSTAKLECAGCCDPTRLIIYCSCDSAHCAPRLLRTLTSQCVTAEQRPLDAAPLARPAAQRGLRARHESPMVCPFTFAPSDLLHLICLFSRPLDAFLQIRSIRFVCSDSFPQICLFSGFKGFEWIAASVC
jgi:hypothetical protein